jgi:hypothetical protein
MYQGIPPVPDRQFVEDLQQYDGKLSVEFNRKYSRFVIVREVGLGKKYEILVVQGEDGGFRQPDHRDLKTLGAGDLWRKNQEARDMVRAGEEKMRQLREKQDADNVDDIRYLSRENRIQLHNTFRKASNNGSKAPEFRRVYVKSPGKTLEQIRQARAAGHDPWAGQKVA